MVPYPRRAAPERGPWTTHGPGVVVFSMRMIRLQQGKQENQEAENKFAIY